MFNIMCFNLWMLSCIIAIPFVVIGFIYESIKMGFDAGKDFTWVVYRSKL